MKLEAAAAVLGVAVDADPETLKAAYRRLALRWHPDKCKDADAKERFQEVSEIYTLPGRARVFIILLKTQKVFCKVIRPSLDAFTPLFNVCRTSGAIHYFYLLSLCPPLRVCICVYLWCSLCVCNICMCYRGNQVSVAYTRLVSGDSGRDHDDDG